MVSGPKPAKRQHFQTDHLHIYWVKTASGSLQDRKPDAAYATPTEVGPTKIQNEFYGGSPSGKVKITSGNLQGNLPMQIKFAIAKFRGRGTWHGFCN